MILLAPSALRAQPTSTRQTNEDTVRQTYEKNLAEYGKNADMLVLPGLLADRKSRLITLWGEATGVSPDALRLNSCSSLPTAATIMKP